MHDWRSSNVIPRTIFCKIASENENRVILATTRCEVVANKIRLDASLMLEQRRRRWDSIRLASGQCPVLIEKRRRNSIPPTEAGHVRYGYTDPWIS